MICCYILHRGWAENADDALKHYGQTRTHDTKVHIMMHIYILPYRNKHLFLCQPLIVIFSPYRVSPSLARDATLSITINYSKRAGRVIHCALSSCVKFAYSPFPI